MTWKIPATPKSECASGRAESVPRDTGTRILGWPFAPTTRQHTSLKGWEKGPKKMQGLKARDIIMPQSLSLVIIHLIFSTKDRRGFLGSDFRSRMHAYLASVSRKLKCECLRVGGTADHVHLAIRLSRTITIAKLVEQLKTSSSVWAKEQSPDQRAFAWQRGYGCFSVSPRDSEELVAYVDNQEEHHKKRSFQEEFRMFLDKYGVNYDEAYLWD